MASSPPATARLVEMCVDVASAGPSSVERWRRQHRTRERMPNHLADALFRRLLGRRLLFPSLLEVFQYCLEEVDLSRLGFVDAEWLAYLGAFRHLWALNLADCRNVNSQAIWSLTGMTCLKELDLSRCSIINDAGIEHLLSISNLKKLSLSETGVSAEGLLRLSCLQNLHVLDLGGLPVTDRALHAFQVLSQLEHLDMWGSKVSNKGIGLLKMFRNLSFLNLAWTGVTGLVMLQSLKYLNMGKCSIDSIFREDAGACSLSKLLLRESTFSNVHEIFSHVTLNDLLFLDVSGSDVEDFFFLRKTFKLEHLDLSFTRMTDKHIDAVAEIGNKLITLNLGNTKISSHGISILAGNVPNLNALVLSCTAVDDVGLLYIALMPSLKSLMLNNTKVRGFFPKESCDLNATYSEEKIYSLTALQDLAHLQVLDLEYTGLQDEALQPLPSFKELTALSLRSDFLSDVSLTALSAIPKLEKLKIRGSVLTDYGLSAFKLPVKLRLLDLNGSWLLSKGGILAFSRRHPEIEVNHELLHDAARDKNAAAGSSSYNATVMKPLKPNRGIKSPQASSHEQESYTIKDERIKYNRVELLNLQLSSMLLQNISVSLPEGLVSETFE